MAFSQSIHGNNNSTTPNFSRIKSEGPSFSFFDGPSSYFGEMSEESQMKIAAMQNKLNQKLGPEYLSQRPGPGGGPKLTYAEGWKIINLANEVFGFNGWSSSVVNVTNEFCDEREGKFSVGVSAVIRVTLRDGVYHEDIGFGGSEGMRQKGASIEKAKKEAVTDGVKRTLRSFGNLLGNCLYDKSYTAEVTKIKVPPAKFNKDNLYRATDPNEPKSNTELAASTSNATTSSIPTNQPTRPLTSLPPHLRNTAQSNTNNSTADNAKGKTPAYTNANAQVRTPQSNASNAPPQVGLMTPDTPVPQRAPATGQAAKRVTFTAAGANSSDPFAASSTNNPQPLTSTHAIPNLNSTANNANNTSSTTVLPGTGILKSNTLLSDDSFDFGSQDDAFLAAVELDFEGDLGRPIVPEEERVPLSIDAGEDVAMDGGGEAQEQKEREREKAGQQQMTRTSTGLRAGILDGLRQRSQEQENGKESPRDLQPQQERGVEQQQQQRPEGQHSHDANTKAAQRSNRLMDIIAATSNIGGGGNQNSSSNADSNNTNANAGMNPGNSGFQTATASMQQQARPLAGSKRSSDAMLGTRRPVAGMGLSFVSSDSGLGVGGGPGFSAATTTGGNGGRVPLGRLEVNENGDVKRVRR